MYDKKIRGLFILIAMLLVIGFGVTFAYFVSSTDFENEFNTGVFQTTATEVFESPQNWLPGDTEPKTLTITNTGNVDVKARVCISEEWTSSSDETLPNVVDGERMAIINLDNTSDWTKKGNCYEYNDTLEPNDTTSSFIESVTFNPNATADLECTTETLNGTTTKECTSTGDGYDNATYTLTLRVETVQANKASEVWLIDYVNRQVAGSITVGDEISIGGEHFYVVSSDSNKTVLLSKYNLLVGDVYDYANSGDQYNNYKTSFVKELSSNDTGYGLQSSEATGFVFYPPNVDARFIGMVPFSGTNYWDGNTAQNIGSNWDYNNDWDYNLSDTSLLPEYSQDGASYDDSPFPYVYRNNIGNTIAPTYYLENGERYVQNNGYTISYYVENYINTLKGLGAPSSISGRLLSAEEAISLGCNMEGSPFRSCVLASTPSWLYSTGYWLGSAFGETQPFYINSNGRIVNDEVLFVEQTGVRPVIEIPTSELN